MHNTEASGFDIISIYIFAKVGTYFIYIFSFGKLLKELKKINFTMDNQMFYFNASGNFMNGYDLINWQPQEASGQRRFVVVGNYNLTKTEVHIKAPIIWSNPSNTVRITNSKTHQLYMESQKIHTLLKGPAQISMLIQAVGGPTNILQPAWCCWLTKGHIRMNPSLLVFSTGYYYILNIRTTY